MTHGLFDLPEPNTHLHPAEAAYYASVAAQHTWHTAAEKAMRHLAESGAEFSADDLRDLLHDAGEPPTPNAWGGLFISWSKQGLIRRTGGGSSRGAKRNGGHRHTWVGVQAEEREAA